MTALPHREQPQDASVPAPELVSAADPDTTFTPGRRRRTSSDRWRVLSLQVALVVVFLAAWQFLPKVDALRNVSHIFDPFYVSSPELVARRLQDMLFGGESQASTTIWRPLWLTFSAAVVAAVIGLVLGILIGLLLSNSPFLARVFTPFVVALNAVPRVALIPLVIILFGVDFRASVINGLLVAFFVSFFNAFEGGKAVPREIVQNSRMLGAKNRHIMFSIRLPYVLVWTFGSLPLVVTFTVLTVLTAEILTGYGGLGSLLSLASTSADSTGTIALVFVLAVFGVCVVGLTSLLRHRVLHWWEE